MKEILIFAFLFLGLGLTSCKKDKNDDTPSNGTVANNTVASCSTNSGSFEMTMSGNEHILQVNDQTNFTILYGWYGNQENNIVIIGEDQNGKPIYIEGILPGVLTLGSHHFNENDLGSDFFDIDLDTSAYYASELTVQVIQSNFNATEGIYKPIRGTFEGIGHSYPWSNGQPPADTIAFSGEFCLNGFIN
jgi:hypothetical protein